MTTAATTLNSVSLAIFPRVTPGTARTIREKLGHPFRVFAEAKEATVTGRDQHIIHLKKHEWKDKEQVPILIKAKNLVAFVSPAFFLELPWFGAHNNPRQLHCGSWLISLKLPQVRPALNGSTDVVDSSQQHQCTIYKAAASVCLSVCLSSGFLKNVQTDFHETFHVCVSV